MSNMNKEEEKDIKDFLDFLKYANDVCKEKGKIYEFECPICKGTAKAVKSSYNGHLHAECKECDLIIQE